MKCFFLADDHDAATWAMAQDNFHTHTPEHWKIERFFAVSGQNAGEAWHDLLLRVGQPEAPFLVATTGCLFGPNSCQTIENSIAHLQQSGGFDLLFADLRLTHAGPMADLFNLRRSLLEAGRTRLIDPRTMGFTAPGVSVVHPRAVSALAPLALGAEDFAQVIERALCQPVRDGALMGRFIFPFATTWSTGDDAQVPADKAARNAIVGDIYRRMVWRDGGGTPELQSIAEMSKGLSTEAKALAILWAALAD